MNINFKQSLTYIFNDKSWILKFLTIIVLMVICNFLYAYPKSHLGLGSTNMNGFIQQSFASNIIAQFITFLIFANITLNTDRRIHNRSDWPLYQWVGNFKEIIIEGLKLYFLYVIIYGIMGLIVYRNLFTGIPQTENEIMPLIMISNILVPVIYILCYLAHIRDLKFISFFNIKTMFKYLTHNKGLSFISIILAEIILIALALMLSKITIYSAFITIPYILYVISDLNAQLIKQIL